MYDYAYVFMNDIVVLCTGYEHVHGIIYNGSMWCGIFLYELCKSYWLWCLWSYDRFTMYLWGYGIHMHIVLVDFD